VGFRLASQLRLLPIYTPGWREANRVRCLAQGLLETVWDAARFKPTTFGIGVQLYHYSTLNKNFLLEINICIIIINFRFACSSILVFFV
jgi:hypothetical protein